MAKHHIYVASSWRNQYYEGVVAALREATKVSSGATSLPTTWNGRLRSIANSYSTRKPSASFTTTFKPWSRATSACSCFPVVEALTPRPVGLPVAEQKSSSTSPSARSLNSCTSSSTPSAVRSMNLSLSYRRDSSVASCATSSVASGVVPSPIPFNNRLSHGRKHVLGSDSARHFRRPSSMHRPCGIS